MRGRKYTNAVSRGGNTARLKAIGAVNNTCRRNCADARETEKLVERVFSSVAYKEPGTVR